MRRVVKTSVVDSPPELDSVLNIVVLGLVVKTSDVIIEFSAESVVDTIAELAPVANIVVPVSVVNTSDVIMDVTMSVVTPGVKYS